jgi:hypothetical protein
MKTLRIVFETILVLLLALGCFSVYKLIKKNNQTIEAANQMAQLYRITANEITSVVRGELGVLYPHVDSIMKASGIKVKNVKEVTNIYHKTIYDTISSVFVADSSGFEELNYDFKEKCFNATALLDFKETTLRPTFEDATNMKVSLTNVVLTDTTTTLYFVERESKKILFFNLRIGKKHYFAETHSSCDGEVKTETIKLIKH